MPIKTLSSWPPPDADGVLLVIAHPDDEAMFFAPAVTAVTTRAAAESPSSSAAAAPPPPLPLPLRVLCLSTGDAAGLGRTRARELVRAASALGVPEERVAVLDDPRMRDGMRERWAEGDVARAVADELRRAAEAAGEAAGGGAVGGAGGRRRGNGWALLTFDGQGVSGHPNHRDTSAGVVVAAAQTTAAAEQTAAAAAASGRSAPLEPPAPPPPNIHSVWQLRSEPIALKFLGPVGAAVAALRALLLPVPGSSAPRRPRRVAAVVPARAPVLSSLRAMRQHASQWVWFRWLFVAFSSYGWVNVLERVV